ncbi:MAG TPA: LuxR family transcriptional regulator [Oscillatoriaceae cyanobacterium M33_DOE_052]|uniref:LuxR family transcriptional regulator n=1 Tax=Planktothricoides sp. SpSt-374 TaxID=2282167 RepID=A0A7C3VL18_9CYAN|nr:LuxR family transcriptional regulator [Oscillatoriaceae cyanobacterium M33_DOE_052]
MIPQDFLKAIAAERSVSDSEIEVLSHALAGETITTIATCLDIRPEAVRKRLGEVYKKFHIAGAGPGKMAKLQQILVSQYQEHQTQIALEASGEELSLVGGANKERQDWGEAPDVSIFYGRSEQLNTLKEWMIADECRLVAVLGMGGIGKTALAVKFAQQAITEFDYIIWRSLRHGIPLKDLLDNLLHILSLRRTAYALTEVNEKISQLISYFRHHRCLLILDSVETILKSGELAGNYREEYEEYGDFFRRIGEEPHHSCLVLTSLEKPKEISLLEGKTMPVRSLLLKDLRSEEAREIFKAKGLSEEDKWENLIALYRGNPLALKIIATTIRDLFGGQVSEFLKQNTLVFGDISGLLEQQFQRLSPLEQELLYWLALERIPVGLQKLRQNMLLPVSQRELLEAVASLGRRSLIEKDPEKEEAVFSLQPAVIEYVSDKIIEQVCTEIREVFKTKKTEKLVLLRSHALIQNHAETTVKAAQVKYILSPIKDRLRRIFRSESRIQEYLTQIQPLLQGEPPLEVGYAMENVLLLNGPTDV